MLYKKKKTFKLVEDSNLKEVRRRGWASQSERSMRGVSAPPPSTLEPRCASPRSSSPLKEQFRSRGFSYICRISLSVGNVLYCVCFVLGRILFGSLFWFVLVWFKPQKVLDLEVQEQGAGRVGPSVGGEGESAPDFPLSSSGLLASFVLPWLVDASPCFLPSSSDGLLPACVPVSQFPLFIRSQFV